MSGPSAEQPAAAMMTIARPGGEGVMNIARLTAGATVAHSLYDEDGVLLIAGGAMITEEFVQMLRTRRIRYVQAWHTPPPIRAPDVDDAVIARVESDLTRPQCARIDTHIIDLAHRPRVSFDELSRRADRGRARHEAATGEMESFCKSLSSGGRVSDREIFRIAQEFAEMVAVDLDLLPTILSLRATPEDYLFQHCVNASALSMVIATQLGYRRERVMEIGLAALLQDVGMLRVPTSIRLAPRDLSDPERAIIERHPAYTLEILAALPSLPRDVRAIGFHVHERVDHSGYPRRRGGSTIHGYAKIVAVADVYVAMTSPRPHRPALAPYEAIKTILYECSQGRYDNRVVRALLDCVSLFPTGSLVELNDGRRAQVVRANPDRHTRPVVQALASQESSSGELIDLASELDVKIVQAVKT